MIKFYLDSLGCRLNQSEIESVARQLVGRGGALVHQPADANVSILNTCAVTGEAERKSRSRTRHMARANPDGQIVLTGCYATLAPRANSRLPGVTRVIPNRDKARLAELLLPDPGPTVEPLDGPLPGGRTRAFVKVQDGCDNHCTYCATTIARGPARTRPLAEIVAEIQALEEAGYQEAVLTGVHLGSYGRDVGRPGLRELVTTVLCETGIARIRLSSLEPWDLEPSFFQLWADRRLCRQLHLPVQSGSASVLQRMGRRTTPDAFRRLAQAALDAIPDLALTTDVMVGFPGETEVDFQASLALVEALDWARLHVFRFSPRPGTAAERMEGQVPRSVAQARSHALRQLAAEKQRDYLARFAGRTLDVLWESAHGHEDGSRRWRGHTDNYIAVTTAGYEDLHNRITPTRMTHLRGDHMEGVVQRGLRHPR
jgi:threonylcarbamoyladenosine tRNA methylthiotransferase MtaB